MTFKEFVAKCRLTDTPRGDFLRDARCGEGLPSTIDSWRQLEDYLASQGACSEADEAARGVWREYAREWGRRDGRRQGSGGSGIEMARRAEDRAFNAIDRTLHAEIRDAGRRLNASCPRHLRKVSAFTRPSTPEEAVWEKVLDELYAKKRAHDLMRYRIQLARRDEDRLSPVVGISVDEVCCYQRDAL